MTKDGRGVFKNVVSRRHTVPAADGYKLGKLQSTSVSTTVNQKS
jgi:hypothetical protein